MTAVLNEAWAFPAGVAIAAESAARVDAGTTVDYMMRMNAKRVGELLEQVRSGNLSVDDALQELQKLPFTDIGFARVDHHRSLRMGIPEVVLAQGKNVEQIVAIAQQLIDTGQPVLITRLESEPAALVLAQLPALRYSSLARVATFGQVQIAKQNLRPIALVTAGTSDIPVAEEAAETLTLLGLPVIRIFDVGVAGIHRIAGNLEAMSAAPAVIVVAGMEGALPSVVGGMLGAPVIAVPTSVGYGVSLGGLTALFGMLTSCASGVTVVNIDNGFGAA
ncbi:MAG TPA: nickel pincer cofactor biosynthesis protein LarB, partial [Polyangiaceae bacterium]